MKSLLAAVYSLGDTVGGRAALAAIFLFILTIAALLGFAGGRLTAPTSASAPRSSYKPPVDRPIVTRTEEELNQIAITLGRMYTLMERQENRERARLPR